MKKKSVILTVLFAILTIALIWGIAFNCTLIKRNDVKGSAVSYDTEFNKELNINLPKDLADKKLCFVSKKCDCQSDSDYETDDENNPTFSVLAYSEPTDDYESQTVKISGFKHIHCFDISEDGKIVFAALGYDNKNYCGLIDNGEIVRKAELNKPPVDMAFYMDNALLLYNDLSYIPDKNCIDLFVYAALLDLQSGSTEKIIDNIADCRDVKVKGAKILYRVSHDQGESKEWAVYENGSVSLIDKSYDLCVGFADDSTAIFYKIGKTPWLTKTYASFYRYNTETMKSERIAGVFTDAPAAGFMLSEDGEFALMKVADANLHDMYGVNFTDLTMTKFVSEAISTLNKAVY